MIHHIKSPEIHNLTNLPYLKFFLFPLQVLKEVFAHQLITAPRVVQAQCPAQLEPTPTSQGSLCVPAAPLDTTVQKRLATSPSSPARLASTAQMVD